MIRIFCLIQIEKDILTNHFAEIKTFSSDIIVVCPSDKESVHFLKRVKTSREQKKRLNAIKFCALKKSGEKVLMNNGCASTATKS